MYAHICIHHTHIHIQKLVKKSVDFSNENRMANGIVTCFILSKKGKIETERAYLVFIWDINILFFIQFFIFKVTLNIIY